MTPDSQCDKRLNLQVYQRSADMLIGIPFNIASYALLLALVAHHCGYTRGELILTLGDCHVYTNQTEGLDVINRIPFPHCTLRLNHPADKDITTLTTDDIDILNYQAHQSIKLQMAI